MNVAATSGANVAIMAAMMRKRVIEHFQKAGALTPETAVPLHAKHPRAMVKTLIKHGVIVPAGEGLFYLDLSANDRWNRDQALAAVAIVVALVLLLGVVLAGLALVG